MRETSPYGVNLQGLVELLLTTLAKYSSRDAEKRGTSIGVVFGVKFAMHFSSSVIHGYDGVAI